MMAALTLPEKGILYEKVKQYPVLFDKQLNTEKKMVRPMHRCSGKRNRNREIFIVLTQK